MKALIEKLANGNVEYFIPTAEMSDKELDISVTAGEKKTFEISLDTTNDRDCKGVVYTTDSRIEIQNNQFFGKNNKIRISVDAKYLEPDQPDRVYCQRCLTYQRHAEFNRYYNMNHQLIISFIRGTNFKNNSTINFKEELNLEPYVDEKKDSPKHYYLVGSINRVIVDNKEEFFYFTRDPENYNYWHIGNKYFLKNNAPIEEIKNNGQIIMLFYNNIMNKPKKKTN